MPTTSQFPVKPIHTLKTHNGPVNALSFSSYPGTYLLTGSSDRSIHLTRAIPNPSAHPGNPNSNATPAETTSPIQRYDAHGYSVLDVAVATDNARFASVGGDRQVFLWDVETGATVRRWSGHLARVEAVEFGGVEGGVVISGSADTTINLWDTRSNSTKPIQSLTEATDTVSSLHVHNPSYSIASGSYDGRVRVYDIRMGRVMVDRVAQAVTSVRCSGDGNAVLVSSLDSRVRLLDRVDGRLLKGFGMDAHSIQTESGVGAAGGKQYRNTELRIRSVFAKGDGVVLSGGEAEDPKHNGPGSGQGANMFAWDVLTGEVVAVVSAGEGVRAVSCVGWNEREGCWAGGCSDGTVKVYG